MGYIWFCLAINNNLRLKLVMYMYIVMYALKIVRYGYA